MAKLPTNYVDDILDTSVNEHRTYKLTEVGSNTYTFEDKTKYSQKGTVFDAQKANATNKAVNDLIDKGNIMESTIGNIIAGNTVVGKANFSTTSEKATKLATPVKINGVDFDGSKSITISDSTKLPKNSDFVLKNITLNFVGNTCTVSDSRITSSAIADVYFNAVSQTEAKNCNIWVDTYNGYVEFVADTRPTKALTVSIHIKVV